MIKRCVAKLNGDNQKTDPVNKCKAALIELTRSMYTSVYTQTDYWYQCISLCWGFEASSIQLNVLYYKFIKSLL